MGKICVDAVPLARSNQVLSQFLFLIDSSNTIKHKKLSRKNIIRSFLLPAIQCSAAFSFMHIFSIFLQRHDYPFVESFFEFLVAQIIYVGVEVEKHAS